MAGPVGKPKAARFKVEKDGVATAVVEAVAKRSADLSLERRMGKHPSSSWHFEAAAEM
jgi:hypothetical protein